MGHRYPKVSENFKILSRHRLLFGYVTFNLILQEVSRLFRR